MKSQSHGLQIRQSLMAKELTLPYRSLQKQDSLEIKANSDENI